MSILASRYGFTRPAAIAARLASLRTRFAPNVASAIETPVEVEDARQFTDADAPPEMEVAPSIGTPATLETVEALAHDFDAAQRDRAQHALLIESHIVEREMLRRDLAKVQAAEYDGAGYGVNLTEEIEAIESRLETLDDYLVFEDDRPFIFGFDDLSPEKLQTLVLA